MDSAAFVTELEQGLEQVKGRAAVDRTLELAQEMQNLYVRQGMRHAPGC